MEYDFKLEVQECQTLFEIQTDLIVCWATFRKRREVLERFSLGLAVPQNAPLTVGNT